MPAQPPQEETQNVSPMNLQWGLLDELEATGDPGDILVSGGPGVAPQWVSPPALGGGVTLVTGLAPVQVANPTTEPEISIDPASKTALGVVRLATQADIINGTPGRVVDAQELAATLDALAVPPDLEVAFRQIAGGGSYSDVVLTSRFRLYVNPSIGRDTYVSGIYDATTTPPLLNQQLMCGYSPFSPFRTIQRALLEADRLSVLLGAGNDLNDKVVIEVCEGEHIIYVGGGQASVNAWPNNFEPSPADLAAFNPVGRLGVIVARGNSLQGVDLRKVVLKPSEVPAPTGNPATGRGSIFLNTGGSLFWALTFEDADGVTASHHLMSCFEPASLAELNAYYDKLESAFGLTAGSAEVMPGENTIVADYPDGTPTAATDSTDNSSCYVFNCSVRSEYGLCGIYNDGRRTQGFKSYVTAQFTNVCLQKDMNAWAVYSVNQWLPVGSYANYIAASPDNLRFRVGGAWDAITDTYQTDWRSFGFKCIADGLIQEVSIFVIGHAVHHWTASGGQLTVNGGNSNFGMTSLVSSGFRGVGTTGGNLRQDSGFLAQGVLRPAIIPQDGSNLLRFGIGRVSSYNPATGVLTLEAPVNMAEIERRGYSLRPGSYIWVENTDRTTGPGAGAPGGGQAVHAHGLLAASPWSSGTPDQIRVVVGASTDIGTIDPAKIAGSLVYLRRLVDTRSRRDRTYGLRLSQPALNLTRRPQGQFVLRIENAASLGGQLDPSNGPGELFLVDEARQTAANGNAGTYEVLLRTADSTGPVDPNRYYLLGDPVYDGNRVKRALRNALGSELAAADWEPSLSMVPSARGVRQERTSMAPLVIIDNDQSPDPQSEDLGLDLLTDPRTLAQLRSGADYLAMRELMEALGYQSADALSILMPQPGATADERMFNPTATLSPTPNGKITTKTPWPLCFNRPSWINAFGQAYEWVGHGNYTKALPRYQQVLSDQLKIDALAARCHGGVIINTGFTEEGLVVQSERVLDLATGRELSLGVAGVGGLAESPSFVQAGGGDNGQVVLSGIFPITIETEGSQSEISVERASRTGFGVVRYANDTEVAAGTPDVAVDAAVLRQSTVVYRGVTPPDNPVVGDIWVNTNGFPQEYIWIGTSWWAPTDPLLLLEQYAASFMIVPTSTSVPVVATARPSGHLASECLIDWGDGAVTPGITGSHVYAEIKPYRLQFLIKPDTAIFDAGGGWPTLSNANWVVIGPFSSNFRCNQYFWGGAFTEEVNFTDTLTP